MGVMMAPEDVVLIALGELNASGQSSWAMLTTKGTQTVVTLSLPPAATTSELVHIHSGQCGPNLDSVSHPLTNISASGSSVTSVDVSLASLRSSAFAINAHKQGAPATYSVCGNLPAATAAMTGTPTVAPARLMFADIVGFRHQDLTISPGTTVSWTNRAAAPHTSTAGAPRAPTGMWASGSRPPGPRSHSRSTSPGRSPTSVASTRP